MKISTTRACVTVGLLTFVVIFFVKTFHIPNPTHNNEQHENKGIEYDTEYGRKRASIASKFVYNVQNIDCARLFARDATELKKNWTAHAGSQQYNLDIERFVELSRTTATYCDILTKERGYVTTPLSQEEADMPIAYSVMIFKNVNLFERLLRAIYRPQNYYCIHVDRSSDAIVHATVQTIVRCFPNVFLPATLIDVEYTKFSSLQAELLCMRELLKFGKWKYFINLTGQEFPLQTSIALVRILKAFNGANSVEGTVIRNNKERYSRAPPVPSNITLTKGAVHIVASRAYVNYVINNKTAIKFLNWVNKTDEPDETFFSSLNHSPQLRVPGSYSGWPESFTAEYPFMARFKNWRPPGPFSYPCAGKFVRSVCVFGVGDLALLARRPELFANKFNEDFEPAAYACMEELLFNRTLDELTGRSVFNASSYGQLSFVKNRF